MKIKFRDIRMSKANKERLSLINKIIEEYQAEGYVLTLRQLYYQLVSRDVIPNKQAEYSKLSILLKEGRMAGIVDWEAIEDRLRKPSTPAAFDSPKDIINAAINQYRKDRQEGQPVYMEVWVEKDALSGVLSRVTKVFGVPIMVNRGYSSASAMFDSYERFMQAFENGQTVKILYLGDFDPSGVDMIRDIQERVEEFIKGSERATSLYYEEEANDSEEYENYYYELVREQGVDSEVAVWMCENLYRENLCKRFQIVPIALTQEQIRLYEPPPNPAKITDPRAKDFIEKYGRTSWEVDALKPEVLNRLLHDSISDNLDQSKHDAILQTEKKDIKKLQELTKDI